MKIRRVFHVTGVRMVSKKSHFENTSNLWISASRVKVQKNEWLLEKVINLLVNSIFFHRG